MENPTVSGLRSRSRSKTPFLRSSCDRESCLESEEYNHQKTGRRTPIKRSTPIKQHPQSSKKGSIEPVPEVNELPAHRTRRFPKTSEKLIKTSDYSSEESLDRLKTNRKEIYQNEINSQYESVSSSRHYYSTLADVTLSPITHNVTHDRSSRIGSPTYSACSTDSSFAEQALADASALLDKERNLEHLPYRLYKMAGEYWNKYPKTDYTYSPMSRDRVELAPGQVAVPNMSRRSLSQFRIQGPNTVDEPDKYVSSWTSTVTKKRFPMVESSDDENPYNHNRYAAKEERWWLTQFLAAIFTTIRTSTRNAHRKVFGPSHRYPYTDRRPAKAGIVSKTASVAAASFYWIYTLITSVITTTVTTVTETISPSKTTQDEKYRTVRYKKQSAGKWKLLPLLLLLPAVGYCSYYTYENFDHLALPNFTELYIDLSEFTTKTFQNLTMPTLPNLTLPEINLTLPNMKLAPNLDEVSKKYTVYKEVVQNRIDFASDYLQIVAESCWEEIRRVWHGVLG